MGEMSPFFVAGLLYLGSGVGLSLYLISKKVKFVGELRGLKGDHKLKLMGAVLFGGVLAPLLLAYGIQVGSAFEVSLLLNLETVATTLLAVIVFREHVGREVWIGKALIVIGAIIVSFQPGASFAFSHSGFFIAGACLFWGLDNNLTRDVENLSPAALATIKGLVAGLINLSLAFMMGSKGLGEGQILGILVIGALSYGVSLILFVKSLRMIGASRTSTYFAVGPFIGMITSVIFLGDRPPYYQWLAPLLMIWGLRELLKEKHSHLHTHEPLTHCHRHVHDEHHQHIHDGTEGPEPHEHWHTHESLTHEHPHFPDVHHRHKH
jgi:drug/metabolite transporter (DMT)-like permease